MPIKVETYDFKSTRISEFRFVNDTSSTFVIRTNDNGNEIQAQNIIYTPNGLAEGEEFTIKIEKTTLSKISDNPSKKYYSRYKVNTTRYVLKFTYSKFSGTHALVKASNLGDLKKDNVIYKELEREYVFKTCYISEFTLNNDTNNNISIQTDSEPLATLQKNQSKTYTFSKLPEKYLFKVIITSYDLKASKNFIYVISCYHSKYSDASIKINASNLASLQENNVIKNKELDYTDKHLRYMGFHNGAPYIADFIVSYRSPGSSSWTDKKIDYFNMGRGTDKCSNQKDYPNKVYDLSKLNLPKGYEVTAKVNAQGGIGSRDNARSKAIFVYHPSSNRVARYKCSGTSCNTSINNPSATNL